MNTPSFQDAVQKVSIEILLHIELTRGGMFILIHFFSLRASERRVVAVVDKDFAAAAAAAADAFFSRVQYTYRLRCCLASYRDDDD